MMKSNDITTLGRKHLRFPILEPPKTHVLRDEKFNEHHPPNKATFHDKIALHLENLIAELPEQGQQKQSGASYQVRDVEAQGLSSFLIKAMTDVKEEFALAENASKLKNVVIGFFQSLYDVGSKYIGKLFSFIKDAACRLGVFIYHLARAALNQASTGCFALFDFVSSIVKTCSLSIGDYFSSAISYIQQKWKMATEEKLEVEAQGFGDCLVSYSSSILTGLVSIFLQIAERCNLLSGVSAKFDKVTGFFSKWEKVSFSKTTNLLSSIFYVITGSDLTTESAITRSFSDSAQKLSDIFKRMDLLINPPVEMQHEITNQFRIMEAAYSAMDPGYRNYSQYTQRFKYFESKVRPWSTGVKSGGKRVKPVVICLSGASGTGKTTAQKGLTAHVPAQLAALFQGTKREDVAVYAQHATYTSAYSVPCLGEKNEFDDGYRDPLFYCFEEYLTSKDQKIKAQWANHFMKCIDDQPYQLNMAFDKGNRYFTSPFVIATGNYDRHYVHLEDPCAYHRRIELDLIVTRSRDAQEPYDPYKDALFHPTDAMKEVYRGNKAPCTYIKDFMISTQFKSFNYDTLLALVVGSYITRLIAYHVTSSPAPKTLLEQVSKLKGDEVPDGLAVYAYRLSHTIPPTPADRGHLYTNAEVKFERSWYDSLCIYYEAMQTFASKSAKFLARPISYIAAKKSYPEIQAKVLNYLEDLGITVGRKAGDVMLLNYTEEEFKLFLDKVPQSKFAGEMVKIQYATLEEAGLAEPDNAPDVEPTNVDAQGGGKQEYKLFVYEPGTPSMPIHELNQAIYASFKEFMALQYPFNIAMPSTYGPIISQCKFNKMQIEMETLMWDPAEDEQAYPVNAFIHFHYFQRFLSQAKTWLGNAVLPQSHTALDRSRWSNIRNYFARIYFHWVMCEYATTQSSAKHSKSLAVISSYWEQAFPYLTPFEKKVMNRDVKMTFGKELNVRGQVIDLTPKTRNAYAARQHANDKRNARRKWDKEEAKRLEKLAEAMPDEDEETEIPHRNAPLLPEKKKNRYVTRREVNAKERRCEKNKDMSMRHERITKAGVEPQMFTPSAVKSYFYAPKPRYVVDEEIWASVFLRKCASSQGIDMSTIMCELNTSFFTSSYVNQLYDLVNDPDVPLHVATARAMYAIIMKNTNLKPHHQLKRVLAVHCLAYCSVAITKVVTDEDYLIQENRLASTIFFMDDGTSTTFREAVILGLQAKSLEPYEGLLKGVKDAGLCIKTMINNHTVHPLVTLTLATSQAQIACTTIAWEDKVLSSNILDHVAFGISAQFSVTDDERRDMSDILGLFDPALSEAVVTKYFHDDKEQEKSTIVGILTGAAVLAVAGALLSAVYTMVRSYLFHPTEITNRLQRAEAADAEEQSRSPQTGEVPRITRNDLVNNLTKTLNVKPHMGSGDDEVKKLKKNMYSVRSEGVDVAFATFIGGTVCLMNTHVWLAVKDYFQLHPLSPTTSIPYIDVCKSNVIVLHSDVATDVTVIVVRGAQPHRKITGMFCTEEELAKAPRGFSCLLLARNNLGKSDVQFAENTRLFQSSLQVIPKQGFVLPRYFAYDWGGARKGACGTLTLATLHNGRMGVFGMHAAGRSNEKLGIATPLTAELLNKFSAEVGKIYPNTTPFDFITFEEQCLGYSLDEDTNEYQTPVHTSAIGPTVFRPTPFATLGFLGGSPVAPAALDEEAYQKGLEKEKTRDVVHRPLVTFQIAEEIADDVIDIFYGGQDLGACRSLTLDEALGSYPNLSNFDKSTSKGIRLRALNLSKRAILQGDQPDREEFEKMMCARIDNMKQGIWERQINFDKLKDETRDLERVQAKKTRIFKVTDFCDNVLMKMALGDLVSKTSSFHWTTPSSCGIDPTSSEWRLIARYFGNSKVLESDISGYDSTVTSLLYWFAWPLIRRVYHGFDQWFACYVLSATINSIRFDRGKGFVLGWQNTSGNWLTTWTNTLMNMGYFCIAAAAQAKIRGLDHRVVLSQLKIKLYSDDNLTSLPYDWWNAEVVSHTFLKLFNVLLTGNDKGKVTDTKTIWECTFLSRGFREERGLIYAPLSMDSLLSQLYYVKVPKGELGNPAFITSQLQINLDNVSRELLEYDSIIAGHVCDNINKFIRENRLPFRFSLHPRDPALIKLSR